ncbi:MULTISPECIES: CCDC90 family protein [unclassified Modicisalibacter]|uniref:CCDC90 family protein n=1 Tax=unclassified Modicisalibacter TaxID=2679913 RepID=UPI001CCB2A80|nr:MULTISPECIES: CCDC90 family protein [unclassified Modicisalibacter]MBZ9559048.1 DUF1640 domain-containing protein [Modicisalibacter sp. R2A 31.J]MBZ9576841.1 DUF1640 domain-containing protein [Modicisalibacter sp. MOD 31.J]
MYAIDTLEFARQLRTAGFTQEQAEAIAEAHGRAFREAAEHTLATKSDLAETRAALTKDIDAVRTDLNQKIDSVRTDLNQKIDSVRSELKLDMTKLANQLTLRLGGMFALGLAFLTAIKFFS